MAESAAYARRGYAGGVAQTNLDGSTTAGATSLPCTDLSTWASTYVNGPATATINEGEADEEVVEFTGISGSTLTGVTRGIAGTTAVAHDSGATITHTSRVRDFDEANAHVADSRAVAHAAAKISFSPTGGLGGTDVQAAVAELDTEKLSIASAASTYVAKATVPVTLAIPVSDETTAITTGTAKVTFRMPFAMTVTSVRASLTTASSSGNPTFDINEGGTSILGVNKLSIDANEKTSTTAATATTVSDTALADDAEITIDIDTAGTGAKGAKVYLIGTRSV